LTFGSISLVKNKIKIITDKLKEKSIKRLVENFLSLSVLQTVNYILPLVTLPYLVRVLGAELFGMVMFAQAFIIYFEILTDYGFSLSATKEISIHRHDSKKISEIFISVMIIKAVLLILSAIIISIAIFSFNKFKSDWLIYYLTFGMVIGHNMFPVWFFQGMERMKYITVLNITAKLIFTILIFVFIQEQSDFIYVPLFNSLGFIMAGILSIWIIFKDFEISIFWPGISRISYYFKDSTQFFLSRASVSLYSNSNTFFIGLFIGNTAVGLYSAAEKLFIAIRMLYNPLKTTLYPYMCKTRNLNLFKKIFFVTMFINLLICILVFFASGFIVNLLYGEGFEVSENLLKLFAILSIIIVPSILIGYPLLAAMGHPKYANLSVVVGSVLHLIMLSAIIPIIDVYLVAIVTMITEFSVLFIRYYGVRKHKLWSVQ